MEREGRGKKKNLEFINMETAREEKKKKKSI